MIICADCGRPFWKNLLKGTGRICPRCWDSGVADLVSSLRKAKHELQSARPALAKKREIMKRFRCVTCGAEYDNEPAECPSCRQSEFTDSQAPAEEENEDEDEDASPRAPAPAKFPLRGKPDPKPTARPRNRRKH